MTVIGRAEVNVIPGSITVGEAAILEVLKDIRESLAKPPATVVINQNFDPVEGITEEEVAQIAQRAMYYRLAGM